MKKIRKWRNKRPGSDCYLKRQSILHCQVFHVLVLYLMVPYEPPRYLFLFKPGLLSRVTHCAVPAGTDSLDLAARDSECDSAQRRGMMETRNTCQPESKNGQNYRLRYVSLPSLPPVDALLFSDLFFLQAVSWVDHNVGVEYFVR